MINGIGVDIIEISKIKNISDRWGDKAFKKVFTEKEIEYCNSVKHKFRSFAARFAAKEAVLKAMGIGLSKGWNWKDIEILNKKSGKPEVNLTGKTKNMFKKINKKIEISLSHSDNYAVASAIITRR